MALHLNWLVVLPSQLRSPVDGVLDSCFSSVAIGSGSCLPSLSGSLSSFAGSFALSNALYFRRLFLRLLAFFFDSSRAFIFFRLLSPSSASSSFSAKILRAILRFCERERVSWHLTTKPEARCFSWTAEFVLF